MSFCVPTKLDEYVGRCLFLFILLHMKESERGISIISLGYRFLYYSCRSKLCLVNHICAFLWLYKCLV